MSNHEPTEPYVYQPRPVNTKEFGDRIHGVGGVSLNTQIVGLTRDEAESVCAVLKELK